MIRFILLWIITLSSYFNANAATSQPIPAFVVEDHGTQTTYTATPTGKNKYEVKVTKNKHVRTIKITPEHYERYRNKILAFILEKAATPTPSNKGTKCDPAITLQIGAIDEAGVICKTEAKMYFKARGILSELDNWK